MRKVTLALLMLMLLSVFVIPAATQDMLPLPAEHTPCEVDLTGETVTLYHIGDISGAYAFITQPIIAAFDDAVKYYNEHGGLCGATVAHYNEDTGGSLEATQASYDRFKGQFGDDMDMLYLYASGDAELLRDQLVADNIAGLISAGSVEGLYGESGNEPGNLFATNPLYVDQMGSFCDYVSDNSATFADPVIGYISWPGAFGEAALTAETISYCASKGVTLLDTAELFLPTDTDITTQVQNLTDAGANILYTNTLASGPALVAETVRTLGMVPYNPLTPDADWDVVLAGVNWVMDTSVAVLSMQRATADTLPAVNGMIGSLPFRWWTEVTNPGVAFVTQQANANERTAAQTRNIGYLGSWGLFDLWVETMIQTVNRVGSLDAITGDDIRTTLEGVDYAPLDLFGVNYGDGSLRVTRENRMAFIAFLNSEGNGPALSRSDAADPLIPILVPLAADFGPMPDLRPGGPDVPSS